MVIISTDTDVGLPTQPASTESIDELPIRSCEAINLGPETQFELQNNPEVVTFGEAVCKEAHVLDVKHIADQLSIEIK